MSRFGHQSNAGAGQHEPDEHEPVNEMKGVRPVLHEHRRRQRSKSQTDRGRGAVDDGGEGGALRGLKVDERSRQRAGRNAGRDPLRDARGKQPSNVCGEQEQQHAPDLNHESCQDHRPAPHRIGK